MILNNKPQMFTVWFPCNFFYPEISDRWLPVLKKMNLPLTYQTIEDYMNFCIQSITFNGYTMQPVTQQLGQYQIMKRGGKEVEAEAPKDFTITFKLTESYVSWWIIYEQMWWFMKYGNDVKYQLYLDDLQMGFLSDRGLLLAVFRMNEITPTGIGNLEMSYKAQPASYNSFNWNLHYNHFDILV